VFGSVALLASVAVAVAVASGLMITLGRATESLAGGALVGLWMLRNHVRTALFARRITSAATLSDVTYTAVGVALVGLFLWLDRDSERVTGVLGALAVANLVAICVALRALGSRIRVSFAPRVWRRYGRIRSDIAWSLIGATTWNVQSQALTFLVAATAGPAAYAPIAAGLLLFTPLRPAVNAFINVFRADFVSALGEGNYRRLKVTLYGVCGVIALACAAVAAGIWLAWPFLDAHIFAGKFDHASMPLIVTLSGFTAVIYLTYNLPLALIQAAGQFRPVALATTYGALVGLCAVSILLNVTSVAWSLAGLVAGEAVCGIYLSIAAFLLLRRRTALKWRTATSINAVAEMRT
jgi:O-antigen/teichoic acid export membrane protein